MFFSGLLFGLTLQMSVGPVCLSVLFLSVSRGFKEAFKMALGVTLVDGFYIVTSFLGMSNLLKIEFLRRGVLIAGACTLIYFGISTILSSLRDEKKVEVKERNSFLYGIKLTLTNPLTIIFWSGILGTLIAGGELVGISNIFAYSIGCIASTILFLGLISIGGGYASRLLKPNVIKIMNAGVGLYLIYFGMNMLFV